MERIREGFRERLDRSTRRALQVGSGVLVITALVELIPGQLTALRSKSRYVPLQES
jgi:hypothetical protein